MHIYLIARSETYPLSRKPAFIGINKANVSEIVHFVDFGLLPLHLNPSPCTTRRQGLGAEMVRFFL